jgi:anti-anti-sigma regulatory factor
MADHVGSRVNLSFSGDWSIAEVSERLPQLNEWLLTLKGQSGAGPIPEIDLSGVDSLDVCGCQLIAAFLTLLNQQGLPPVVHTVPDHLKDKIHRFGFGCVFADA